MRIALLSDIHANAEAFVQVLNDIDRLGVGTILSLGDNIGYGPDPQEVIDILRQRNIPSVMGNHELALNSVGYFRMANPLAQKSLEITRMLLTAEGLGYCRDLPSSIRTNDSLCVHASPPSSCTTYILSPVFPRLSHFFSAFTERICFFGHTHLLALFASNGQKIQDERLTEGVFPLAPNRRYLVNIGSVGQPRDGNNNAKYIIWDNIAQTLEVRFIPYDIRTTAKRILDRGLPELNAARLW